MEIKIKLSKTVIFICTFLLISLFFNAKYLLNSMYSIERKQAPVVVNSIVPKKIKDNNFIDIKRVEQSSSTNVNSASKTTPHTEYKLLGTEAKLQQSKVQVAHLKKKESETNFKIAVLQQKIESSSIKLEDLKFRYEQTQKQIKIIDVKLKKNEYELKNEIKKGLEHEEIEKKKKEISALKLDYKNELVKLIKISQNISGQKSIYQEASKDQADYLQKVRHQKRFYEKETHALENESIRINSMLQNMAYQQKLAMQRYLSMKKEYARTGRKYASISVPKKNPDLITNLFDRNNDRKVNSEDWKLLPEKHKRTLVKTYFISLIQTKYGKTPTDDESESETTKTVEQLESYYAKGE